MHFEPAGLRITLPADYAGERPDTGLATGLVVKGDFEITVSFEVLREPEAADVGKQQTRLSLVVLLDRPGNHIATLSRSIERTGEKKFLAWMTQWNETARQNQQRAASFPTTARKGRLRLVRTGSVLSYCASEGTDRPFTLLQKYPFGSENLKDVQVTGSTGGSLAALDVRVTDLRIRAEALRATSEAAEDDRLLARYRFGWVGVELLGLMIVVSLAVGLGVRLYRPRRKTGEVGCV